MYKGGDRREKKNHLTLLFLLDSRSSDVNQLNFWELFSLLLPSRFSVLVDDGFRVNAFGGRDFDRLVMRGDAVGVDKRLRLAMSWWWEFNLAGGSISGEYSRYLDRNSFSLTLFAFDLLDLNNSFTFSMPLFFFFTCDFKNSRVIFLLCFHSFKMFALSK